MGAGSQPPVVEPEGRVTAQQIIILHPDASARVLPTLLWHREGFALSALLFWACYSFCASVRAAFSKSRQQAGNCCWLR
jgi:hypothetical protein